MKIIRILVYSIIVLAAITYYIHLTSVNIGSDWPREVTVEVCSEERIELIVNKCIDVNCEGPDTIYKVIADKGPLKFYFEVNFSGVYSLVVNGETREFLVTRRSPDRLETIGCF